MVEKLTDRAIRTPKRQPLSRQDVLTVPDGLKEPGFHYHFFNDVGDRIERAKKAGYEVVTGKVPVGDAAVGNSQIPGSAVQKPVGGGTNAVLMRIKEEWYKEDQAAKIAEIKETEKSMMTINQTDGQYGNITQEQPR